MSLKYDTENESLIDRLWLGLDAYFRHKGQSLNSLIALKAKNLQAESQSPALKLLKMFPLSSPAGLALMSLCECYPRITNAPLRQKLLKDTLVKLPGLLSTSSSVLNLSLGQKAESSLAQEVINVLSSSFVAAQTLNGLDVASKVKEYGGLSLDCLGEAAQTPQEAASYIEKYKEAIKFCQNNSLNTGTFDSPLTVSIKLSALVTDFNALNGADSVKKALLTIFDQSPLSPVSVAVDAEEFHRSDLQREVVSWLVASPRFKHVKFSLAQQAYLSNGLSKLANLLDAADRPVQGIRVVKGAYYDQEVREAQRSRYMCPVLSSKELTDKSWALMSLLLGYSQHFAHFATHNPESLAFLQVIAEEDKHADFKLHLKNMFTREGVIKQNSELFGQSFASAGCEIQYLFGMGGSRQQKTAEALSAITNQRVGHKAYAPVGGQKELLPYLVRRLLENGVNNSVWQKKETINAVSVTSEGSNVSTSGSAVSWAAKLVTYLKKGLGRPACHVENAITKDSLDKELAAGFLRVEGPQWWTPEFVDKGSSIIANPTPLKPPKWASFKKVTQVTPNTASSWASIDSRIASLSAIAEALITHEQALISQLVTYAKKHPVDAYGEWQEALDFVNYYKKLLTDFETNPKSAELQLVKELTYVYGEKNWNYKVGVGSLLCISPWNFPLAITIGQLAAGVAAGVSEIYLKPSPKLNEIYHWIAYLFKDSASRLTLVDGSISEFSTNLTKFDVVLFTGSTQAFKSIKHATADSFTKVIGETGGVNCLMADGSMEPGMVADTLTKSAFSYSGQKCSCVRVAYIDASIYSDVLQKLKQYDLKWGLGWESMGRELIDEDAEYAVSKYIKDLESLGGAVHMNGKAAIVEMPSSSTVHWKECFGPVLQLVKIDLEDHFTVVTGDIRQSGSALTFTLLSKDSSKIEEVFRRPLAGNQYVNRGSTGAVVQAQPFGGFKDSGTGPKIGTAQLVEALCVDIAGCFDTSLMGGTVGLFDGNPEKLLVDPRQFLK